MSGDRRPGDGRDDVILGLSIAPIVVVAIVSLYARHEGRPDLVVGFVIGWIAVVPVLIATNLLAARRWQRQARQLRALAARVERDRPRP